MKRATTIILLLLAAPIPACTADRAPNVVFFLVDDLGYMDIGANNPASFYDTPNIDRLAASGVRFTQAYAACPVCSPTRASILSGKYPPRTGITDYISQNRGNQPEKWRRKTAMLPAPYADRLELAEVTLAEAFKDARYATFFAGKWHLGPEGFFPEDQGFDVNMGGLARGGPYGGMKYFSPYGNARLSDGPDGEHLPDRLAREAAAFIDANADTSFFVYLSFYSVHTPLIGRPDLVEKYDAKRTTVDVPEDARWRPERKRKTRLVQDHAVYAAMVEAMDQAVGTVLDTLDRGGHADDTIVVFFSDNGGLSTSEGHPTSNEPLRAGKGWLYEGGIREPCIIRAPGVTPAGAVCDEAFTSTDFYPTLLELAGLRPRHDQHVDGTSIVPALRDPASASVTWSRGPMYWHYPHYGNQGSSPGGAVRNGDWKLIEWYEDGAVELYNLAHDPREQHDLAAAEPERTARLLREFHAWRLSVGGIMPTAQSEPGSQRGSTPSR